ncbi:MAG: type IV pilus assembly protein PilM [Actinomycetota bacterium]|nr:type IV pilus assembly protein PilM [Actinomycetota bacterium]
MALPGGPTIGLDIGTSAVRAAQVLRGKSGGSLAAFGQVALPPGIVADGEIRDPGPVSEAIAQLWKRTKLRSKKAIIGVANQRVVVRQVDLPFLEEKEFRSSLRYQVSDHIPMPVDAAELDFQIIEDYMTEDGDHMMRVLLVAAATDMVEGFLSAVSAAGIIPAGVDLTPFAVARAVSSAARGETGVAGAEAIVDVGAGVTNVVVHHNGEARFVRILLTGGDDPTLALAEGLDVSYEEAEAMKLDISGMGGPQEVHQIIAERVEALVHEIRGSLDYYSAQEDSEPLTSLIMTGGGSLTPGLIPRLERTVGLHVQPGKSLAEMETRKSGLTPEQIDHIEPVAAAAVGLAMGGSQR